MQINRLTGSRVVVVAELRQKCANLRLPVAYTGEESDDADIASAPLRGRWTENWEQEGRFDG